MLTVNKLANMHISFSEKADTFDKKFNVTGDKCYARFRDHYRCECAVIKSMIKQRIELKYEMAKESVH